MDPKEVKQLLKEAKENLRKNEYIGAAKACKVRDISLSITSNNS